MGPENSDTGLPEQWLALSQFHMLLTLLGFC
jgi:hypothetical protein